MYFVRSTQFNALDVHDKAYLNGPRDDLGGARGAAVDEHHQRSGRRPDRALRAAVRHVLEVTALDRHDPAPLGHEEGGNVYGSLQQAALN